jgi:hypothetical protein
VGVVRDSRREELNEMEMIPGNRDEGAVRCMKYLHELGCPWNADTCRWAAQSGHLDCLKYLHENGCPWNEDACQAAAENGHLDCLKYLQEHGDAEMIR